MIIYELTEEKHHNDTIGHYTSFGIKAVDSFSGKSHACIEDVFADFETAKECVALFNAEQLELVHLEEAIENILHFYQV